MKVTRVQLIQRGLSNCCPNCGGHTLFREGTFFELNKNCPNCGLRIERDEGFFLGSLSLNYGVTVVVFLLPVMILTLAGVISSMTGIILAGIGAIGFPILFYRSSRSWWLMFYYYFLPQHLPVNQRPLDVGEDENT